MTPALAAAQLEGEHMVKELKEQSSFCGEMAQVGKGLGLAGI